MFVILWLGLQPTEMLFFVFSSATVDKIPTDSASRGFSAMEELPVQSRYTHVLEY